MLPSPAPWYDLLAEPPEGAHVILWSDNSPACDSAVETFLRGGLVRNDLIVIIVPAADFADLRKRLRERGLELDHLEEVGRVLIAPPEHLGLDGPKDVDRIEGIAKDLRWVAERSGRAGITVLGGVGPGFFDSGDENAAAALEHALQDHAQDVRILCTYRAGSVTRERLSEAVVVIRCHTHAITPVGGDRLIVEPVERSRTREPALSTRF